MELKIKTELLGLYVSYERERYDCADERCISGDDDKDDRAGNAEEYQGKGKDAEDEVDDGIHEQREEELDEVLLRERSVDHAAYGKACGECAGAGEQDECGGHEICGDCKDD